MSSYMFAAVLLAIAGLSTSAMSPPLVTSSVTSHVQQHALVRFYSDFAQLYRATPQPLSDERYQFLFTEDEWANVHEESLSLLYTNLVQRSIVYHPMPNFEVEGTRYFYRRHPKQYEAVEIELVRSRDLLFREVRRPSRYFYLKSFEELEYSRKVPVMPFYEVTFTCNKSMVSNEMNTQAPLLSYIDKSLKWSPRYELDLPMFDSGKKPEMYAYADLINNGLQSFVVKRADLNTGDIKIANKVNSQDSTEYYTYGTMLTSIAMPLRTSVRFTDYMGEQARGTYVYQLTTPSPTITLLPRSTTSINFFEPHVNVDPFLYYSSSFMTYNTKGKLVKAYNITSLDAFMPRGRLMMREQGRFVGELDLPDLAIGETYTMQFGLDADVSYRRYVHIVQGDEDADTIVYRIEIMFENRKVSRDIPIDFIESFGDYKYFDINNISMSSDDDRNNKMPDLVLYGTDLRGHMMLKRQGGQKVIKYEVKIHKTKPITVIRDQ